MSDTINLLKNVSSFETAPLLNGYSKVVLIVGTDDNGDVISYTSGVDGGAVLTVNNPWGTQQMADSMLAKISGWQYQPYTAQGAILDPAAELGDGVTIDGVYSGIFKRDVTFNPMMRADISAPTAEEIEHEYTTAVESATDRAYSRLVKAVNTRISQNATLITLEAEARTAADQNITSQLLVQAGEISARVKKEGGSSSSFGWTLTDSNWTLKSSNNRTVLLADSTGLHVTGEIIAESGTIGGFTILSDYISYGGMTWGSSASNGIYIGTSGIQLGQGVKMSAGGSLELSGSLKIGNNYIQANDLREGANGGNNWTSDGGGGVYRTNTTEAHNVTHGGTVANSLSATKLNGGSCTFANAYNQGQRIKYGSKTLTLSTGFYDHDGNWVSLNFIGY